jgi:hypothetical protein
MEALLDSGLFKLLIAITFKALSNADYFSLGTRTSFITTHNSICF